MTGVRAGRSGGHPAIDPGGRIKVAVDRGVLADDLAGGVAFARRGTKDRGKHREAAGAIAEAMTWLPANTGWI